MTKVIAVVEGLTEQTFVRDILAPWLWDASRVALVASCAGKPGKKGGNSYERVRRDIINHLRNPHFAVVTMFFDFYGMPSGWPGRVEARKKPHAGKPLTVEKAIRDDVAAAVDQDLVSRFHPYVQMHEFEALLFSDTNALPEVMRKASSKKQLDAIRSDFRTPEEINDSPDTAPSKRIGNILPFFRKPLHGILAAKRITIEVMMGQCPHFSQWVVALRSFGERERA